MIRLRSATLAVALLSMVLTTGVAIAASPVGSITKIRGAAVGVTAGATSALAVGVAVFLDEALSTGPAARLEVTFDDGTRLAIGESAKLTIDAFVYKPAAAGNAIRLGIVGPFRYISGHLTKTPGARASVVTPLATIGIRGTDFWGGPIDGQFGVFLVEGAVSVATANGASVLDRSGEGVSIFPGPPLRGKAGKSPPVRGPVVIWKKEKVDRAIATVSFD